MDPIEVWWWMKENCGEPVEHYESPDGRQEYWTFACGCEVGYDDSGWDWTICSKEHFEQCQAACDEAARE